MYGERAILCGDLLFGSVAVAYQPETVKPHAVIVMRTLHLVSVFTNMIPASLVAYSLAVAGFSLLQVRHTVRLLQISAVLRYSRKY